MKQLATIALIAITIACSKPAPPAPTDTREPIGVQYVTAPELKVYEKPDAAAAVVATYQYNETVPVLVRQGEWLEIRVGDGSGWIKASDVGDASESQSAKDNLTPKFQLAPSPVTHLTAKGDIYIEADVNTDGDVVATKVITNTTGSTGLAEQNAAALQKAKFFPIIKNGAKMPFKYYHRVTY
jgi:hypothetical protein